MNNDLISRSDAIKRVKAAEIEMGSINGIKAVPVDAVIQFLEIVPAVDAVEVVRCKDCEHIKEGRFDIFKLAYCNLWKTDMQMDNFCCFGNRRADDDK